MTIDPAARQVFVRGEEVQLTHREFDVLLFLARHPGQVFSRNQLMDAVWQYSFYTDTSTVTVHIRRLRAKIEADPARPTAHPDRVGRRLPLPAVSAAVGGRGLDPGPRRIAVAPVRAGRGDRGRAGAGRARGRRAR